MMGPNSHPTPSAGASDEIAALWASEKYPRTTSTNSSGFFEEDEAMNPYQTPPHSPSSRSSSSAMGCVPLGLQRHIVRMFSTEDASGTSAVAIDNKIEQAMDLVKSHLMIAVREEVEVLKEKISELMDKINQLEVENTILKANMSQETLQQLQMQTQLQIAGNGTQAAIAAPPTQPPPSSAQSQPQSNPANPAVAAVGAGAAAVGTTNAAAANDAAAVANATATQANPAATTTNGPMS